MHGSSSVLLLALAAATTVFAAPIEQRATSTDCSPLELVFARGTTEMQGLGLVGTPLASDLAKEVSGATSYAVVYPADEDFANGPKTGASDAQKHIQTRAAACPDMKFAIAGYSQGAMVVHDISLSSDLLSKVVAVAVFGDPYRTMGSKFPIVDQSAVYQACATGDPVCENGSDVTAHLSYASKNAQPAADFIAQKFQATSSTKRSGSTISSSTSATPTTAPSSDGAASGLSGLGSSLPSSTSSTSGSGGLDALSGLGSSLGGSGTSSGAGLAIPSGLAGGDSSSSGLGSGLSLPSGLAIPSGTASSGGLGDLGSLSGLAGSATSGSTSLGGL